MMAEDGMSPVHAAAQAGHIPCLSFLLSIGVTIRQPAEDGATPAHFAAASGQVDTLEWILDHGGSALDKDNLGGTPVHDAAEQGQVGTLNALIQRGIPTHHEDYEGLKPLDLAKDNQHNECVQLLFKTISPSLLTSITPRHSMTRASAVDNKHRTAELEKQKEFESALMAGVSQETQEAMWSKAQQQASTEPQPGLKLLLEGEMGASPSQYSLNREPLHPAPPGSARSRHSAQRSSRRAPSSSKTIDDMDMLSYKPRPVLSPSLFDGPPPEDTPDGQSHDQPNTKKVKTEASKALHANGMELKPVGMEQRLTVAKETAHKASPIPQRAKFLRKFNKNGKKKKQVGHGQKGVKDQPRSEREDREMEEEGEREDVTVAVGTEAMLGAAAMAELPSVGEMKLAAMQAGSYTEANSWDQHLSNGGRDSSNPYDMVSEELVQGAIRESLAAAREMRPVVVPTVMVAQTADSSTASEPRLSAATESEKLPPMPEKAVIMKQKAGQSLKTAEETITVNFIPQQSNLKRSFPITHAKLLKDEDLTSPGESEEEEAETVARETSSGFENIDLQTFEDFGEDIRGSWREGEKSEEIGKERRGGEDPASKARYGDDSLREEKSHEKAQSFEEVDTNTSPEVTVLSHKRVERAASLGAVKPLAPLPLRKWDNVQDLKQVAESAEVEQPLNSILEEEEEKDDEIEEETGTDKKLATDEKSTPAVHTKETAGLSDAHLRETEKLRREDQQKEMKVLMKVSRIEKDGRGMSVRDDGVRGRGVEMVKSGSVSEKLKMFGGGRKITRTVSDGTTGKKKTGTAPSEGREEIIEDEVAPLPTIDKKLTRRSSEEKLRLDGLPSLSPPQQRSAAASRPQAGAGQRKSTSPPTSRLVSRTPQLGQLKEVDDTTEKETVGGVGHSNIPAQLRRRSSGGVYSPLMISAVASEGRRKSDNLEKKPPQNGHLSQPMPQQPTPSASEDSDEKRRSLRDERARRQLFALSAEGKVGSRESAYMGWATAPPQLGQLKQRWEKEAGEKVKRRVGGLLCSPQLTGSWVPLEFRGLLPRLPGRLSAWRQKAGSLQKVESLDCITFEENDIIIFLKEPLYGPILHHIYLWLGSGASDLSVSSAHQHCQQLLHCLPGGCPLHKETQGHESGSFMSAIGVGVASKLAGSTPYINSSLEMPTLYNLNETFMSFQAMMKWPPSHSDLVTSRSPSLLNTHSQVWVWLPAGYWGNQTGSTHYQKSVFDIGQAFLSQKGYPKWVPVTVLSQHCETLQFISHFASWPDLNFDLAPPTFQPILRNLHLLELTPPTVKIEPTDMKIYRVEGNDRRPLPPVPSSHLSAGGVYMFQWTVCHASPLYTWVETAMCVWVGSRAGDYWTAVESCRKYTEREIPLTLVPSGLEPPQLLSFFKGTLVVHNSPHSSPHPSPLVTPHRVTHSQEAQKTKLYQVSGCSLENIKAIEVPPTGSSLSSTHCYILSSPPLLFSWSGHLATEDTRTGALYIAQILNSSHKPLLVAEGQEDEEFWSCLGGKTSYQHLEQQTFPTWAPPELYCCIFSQNQLSFTQLPPAKKRDLKSNGCYILWYRHQVFVWVGSQWKYMTFPEILKAYLAQCHSGRSARDFVVTVVNEGYEGEGFWQWFELQRCLEPKAVHSSQDLQPQKSKEATEVTDTSEASPKKATSTEIEEEATPTGVGEETKSEGEEATDAPHEAPSHPPTLTEATPPEAPPPEATPTVNKQLKIDVVAMANDGAVAPDSEAVDGDVAMTTAEEAGHVTQSTNQISESKSADNLSVSSLLTQPEDLQEIVTSKQKRRARRASLKPTGSVTLTVEVDGGRVVVATVREGAPVITVMFQVAKAAGLTLDHTFSLFEIVPHLKLQRLLEEHEVIKTVTSQWPTGKQRPRLLLTAFPSKHMLWGAGPPIPKSAITAYIKNNTPPDITNELFYSPRATKLNWKRALFRLSPDGVFITTKSGEQQLYANRDHHLYTPTISATITTPTRFCFALKPTLSWKAKDVKLFCSTDILTMAKWVHGMRLLQHGQQLRVNMQAVKLRLQKRECSPHT